MKFEKGDKVRVKSKKNCIGDYVSEYNKKEFIINGSMYLENEEGSHFWNIWDDLQLILESPKLTLRLSQSGLKLKIKILHQDDSLRGVGEIFDDGTYSLWSDRYAEITRFGKSLCIKGREKYWDCDKISYIYLSQEELDSFVSVLRIMMKDERLQ